MRHLSIILIPALLLAACTGNPAGQATKTSGASASTMPNGQPANQTPTTLSASSRLTLNGTETSAFDKTPKITWIGGGLVTVANAEQTDDKTYSVRLEMKSLKSPTGLSKTFKQEDVDRLELTVEQVVSGRSSNNKWTKLFDVPGPGVTLMLTNANGRVAGAVEAQLKADPANAPDAKGDLNVKYEFENALTEQN